MRPAARGLAPTKLPPAGAGGSLAGAAGHSAPRRLASVVARIGTGDYWWTGAAVLGALLYALGRVLAWWKNG